METYSPNVDLHYSPDDGGWYAQDYAGGAVSEDIWSDPDALRTALDDGSHVWSAR